MAETVHDGGRPGLEAQLRSLGREVAWPAAPDAAALAAAVAAAVAVPRPPARFRPPRRVMLRAALALAVLAAALGVAFAVPPARTGLLDLLGLKGVSLVRVRTLPPVAPAGAAVLRGRRVSLREARRLAGFPVAVPPLGPPAEVRFDEQTGAVGVVWGTPVRVRLVELPLDVVVEKIAASGMDVRPVEVGGAPGAWLSGAPHAILGIFTQPSLAGNTLLWERDGVTFRLDGRLSLAEALRIARAAR